jgi:hypothetical protein
MEIDLIVNEVGHIDMLTVSNSYILIAGGCHNTSTLGLPHERLSLLECVKTPVEDVGVVKEVNEVLPVICEGRVLKETCRTVQGLLFRKSDGVP